MAGKNRGGDSTIRLKADFNDVTQSLKEMNRYIKLSKSEFSAATATMKDWAQSTDGIQAKTKQLATNIGVQQQALARLKAAYREVAEEQGADSKEAVDLQTKINNLTRDINKEQSELDNLNATLKKAGDGSKNYDHAMKDLNKDIHEQEEKVQNLALAYRDSVDETGKYSEKSKELKSALEREQKILGDLRGKLASAKSSTADMGDATARLKEKAQTAADGFTVLKGALANLIAQGVRRAAQGIKEIAQDALEVGMSYEAQMSKVGAIANASEKDMKDLKEAAREMGASTKFTATEAGEGLEYMALAGMSVKDSIEMLPKVLDLAAAGGYDLGRASDQVTDAQTALGLSIEGTNQMIDEMATTSTKTNTSIEQLGDAYLTVGGTAKTLAGGTKELAVQLGVLADNGMKGSEGGTKLRNIILALVAPTDKGAGAMESLGLSVKDAQGNMRPMADIMQDLGKKIGNLGKADRQKVLKQIFNKQDLKAVNALLGTSKKRYEELDNAISNSAGSTTKMAAQMQDNVEGDLTKLKSKIEDTFITLFENAAPAIRDGIGMISDAIDSIDVDGVGKAVGEFLKSAVEWIGKLITNFPTIISHLTNVGKLLLGIFIVRKIISFGQAVAGLVSSFTAVTGAVGAAATATGVLGVAMSALPIIGIVGAIVGLVGAFSSMSDGSDEAYEHITKLSEAQQDLVDKTKEAADSARESAEKREQAMSDSTAEIGYVEELKEEYNSLIGKNGEVKKGYEDRASAILDTMASAMGVERSEIEKNIEANGKLSDSFDTLIAKKKGAALIDAYAEDYKKAIQSQKEQADAVAKANEEVAKSKAVYDEAIRLSQNWEKAVASGNQTLIDAAYAEAEAFTKEHGSMQEITGAYSDMLTSRANALEAYNNSTKVIQDTEKMQEALASNDVNIINSTFESLTNGLKTTASATKEELEQQYKEQSDLYKQYANSAGEWGSGITAEMLDAQFEIVKKSKEQLGQELSDDELKTHAIAKAKALGESIPQSVAEGMKSKSGKEASKIIESYVKFDDVLEKATMKANAAGILIPTSIADGVRSGSKDVKTATKEIKNYMNFADAINKAKAQGLKIPKSIVEGVNSGSMSVEEAVRKLSKRIKIDKSMTAENKKAAQDAFDAVASTADKSASKVKKSSKKVSSEGSKAIKDEKSYKAAQEKNMNAVDSAIKKGGSKIKSSAKNVAKSGASSANASSDYYKSGQNSMQGFINGMESKRPAVNAKAESIAKGAKSTIDNTLKIESPSRELMKSGAYFTEGFMIGIKSLAKKAFAEAAGLGNGTVDALNDALDIHSPSRKTKKAGTQTVKGFYEGIRKEYKKNKGVKTKIKATFYKTLAKYKDAIKKAIKKLIKELATDFDEVGDTITAGLDKAKEAVVPVVYSDIMTQTATLTRGVVNMAKDGVAAVIDELSKLDNFNFSEVSANASSVFSKNIDKKISYTTKRIQYENDARVKQYEEEIQRLEDEKDKEDERLAQLQETTLANYENQKTSYLDSLEKDYNQRKKATEQQYKDNIAKLNSEEKSKKKKLQDKLKKTKDDKKKKSIEKEVKELEKKYDNLRKEEEKVRDKALKSLEKDYNKGATYAEDMWDKKIKAEEKGFEELKKTQSDGYDDMITNMNSYKDTYIEGSQQFMDAWQSALQDYKEAATNLINSVVNEVTSKYQKMYDTLVQKQDALASKLKGAGELFEISGANVLRVGDINEQTKKIKDYTSQLANLKGQVSDALFEEVASYDMEKGKSVMDYLLAMSPQELQAYSDAVAEKMNLAESLSKSVYQDDFDKVAHDYASEIQTAFNGISGELEDLGKDIILGMCEGLTANTDYLSEAVRQVVSGMITDFRTELGIHSPSRVMKELGGFTGQGFVIGLSDSVKDISGIISSMTDGVKGAVNGASLKIRGNGKAAGSQAVNNNSSVVNNYNLVQNNTSPKSLSALETYQARRQQINQLKLYTQGV